VRVTDFGLARGIAEVAVDAPSPTSPPTPRSAERMFLTVTETGAMIGPPAYMAPEQFEGAACDARADQFSFCAALYEALYGIHPFADALGSSMPSLLGTLGPRPLGTVVPVAIHAVLERGMSRDPAARFSSMEELHAARRHVAVVLRRRSHAAAAISRCRRGRD
jgi:eukaryotic-like serine/threonine-protein kinase